MSISFSRSVVAVLLGGVIASSSFAQGSPSVIVRPQVRVVEKVDSTKSTVIANTTPAAVAVASDKGRLAASTPLTGLKLVLKSSDEQENALHGLIDDQQDKSSPNYHKWLTPETFGNSFGAASADVAKVSAWLQDQGFTVSSVSASNRLIQFSGTTGQLEAAFQTEMHHITVNGEAHISNTKNISVPSALAPVIAGVSSLNDFYPRSRSVNPRKLVMGTDGQLHPVVAGTSSPDYTSLTSGSHYVGPADLATIYNGKGLQAAGIDGTGVTIGIIGQTSISLADVQTYRQMFGLPVNDPAIVNVGPPPATIGDDIESDLDLELAGALAVKAKISFYTAGGSLLDGGVSTSALTAVDTNGVDIISLSYGGCELSNAASGTAYWNNLWEQAAAQGQTVFVSTGDSSATGCASSSAALATGATAGSYGVNALGSSAYNVAVGGSMFNEGATALTTGVTPYWGPGGISPYGTALSYIPENVWSEGAFDQVQTFTGVAGGGGGVSMFTARPPWQVGTGITTTDPAGPTFTASGAIPAAQLHRLVPDLSLIAAGNHDGTIFCSEGVCKLNSDGSVAGIGVVGGTSVATPTMAGFQALINQKNGGRQGNANYYYYKLAAAVPAASCSSMLPPAATCNFNDIVTGDNYSPKTATGKYNIATGTISGTLGTDYIGFPATTGFDEATGLGTPNIGNLVNNWSTVTFNASKTTLSLTPTTATHGTSIGFKINVTSNSGTPSGQVSIIAVGQAAGAGDGTFYTLSSGTATGNILSLPGGTYSVIARYTGDSVYGASDSAPVTVTISKEPSTTFITPYNITTAGAVNSATTFAYGTSIYLDTDVEGNSATSVNGNNVLNTGVPTGTVLYNVTSGATALPNYTSNLDAYGATYLEIAQTFTNFLIYANYPVLAPAAYGVKATYSGDNSFGTSNASTAFTVVKATVTPVLRAGTAEIAPGDTAIVNVSIAASGGGVLPTGTVTLTDTTTSTVLGTITLTNGAGVLSTNLIVTPGAHSITGAFNGDANYNASASAAVTITVGGVLSATTIGSSVTTAKVLTSITFTATPPATATGTVYFYDGAVSLGSATISTTTHLATLAVATLTAGTHNVTATYAGSTTFSASSSTPLPIVITQNTPTLSLTSQQANATAVNVAMSTTLALSPANSGVANPAPTAPIQYLDGTTVLGSVPLSYTLNYHTYSSSFTTTALKPGPHTLTASFAGDTNYAAATSGVQNVNIGLTTTTLTSSTTNVGTGIPFTLTATIAALIPNTPAIGGTVQFFDGATLLGTATVTNGVATLTTATLTSVGTHSLKAVYSGDANYYTSTSTSTVTITAVTPSFTISVTPASLTIARGGSGTLSLTGTSVGNYNGFANLSCQGLPSNVYCVFGQPAVLFTGVNGTTSAITITVVAGGSVASNRKDSTSSIQVAGLLWIPAILLAGILGLRRKQLSLRGRQMMAFAILLCGMMAVSGCNGPNTYNVTAPTGTTNFTVAASGNGVTGASPNITATATVALTIN